MKREIIIGGLAVATAGALGYLALSPERTSKPLSLVEEVGVESTLEDKQKIENLLWEEWKDAERYSFCRGEAVINNSYEDPVLRDYGTLEHNSKELLLFDKEANKFFVVAREIEYSYDGRLNTQLGDLVVDVPVSESGSLSEVYAKNEMPIRIDYFGNFISTNPDTKADAWVYNTIGDESEMIGPRIGCAGIYFLDNSPGKDLLVDSEIVTIDRKCEETDINGSYDGDFSFTCATVEYTLARGMFEEVKAKEALQNDKADLPVSEAASEDSVEDVISGSDESTEDVDAQASGMDEVNEASAAAGASPMSDSEEIQKALDQIRRNMESSQ
ncbi:MAG: hypothetical protein PHX30_06030 [Candidatus Pacebacteria bacterium]|nr:hypothetical protein [Candidatus Paceibacterota bacterium]